MMVCAKLHAKTRCHHRATRLVACARTSVFRSSPFRRFVPALIFHRALVGLLKPHTVAGSSPPFVETDRLRSGHYTWPSAQCPAQACSDTLPPSRLFGTRLLPPTRFEYRVKRLSQLSQKAARILSMHLCHRVPCSQDNLPHTVHCLCTLHAPTTFLVPHRPIPVRQAFALDCGSPPLGRGFSLVFEPGPPSGVLARTPCRTYVH